MVMGPNGSDGDDTRSHLEEFISLVAHEVRTPLAIVSTATTMLARLDRDPDPARPEERAALLAMITRNVDLAMLLMDRLSLARHVEAGTVELAKEAVDLVTLVRQSVDDLVLAVLYDHPVEVVTVGELKVVVDPTAAREIVFNLLSNAAKYSAASSPIRVAVDRHAGSARIVVRNHGGGVTPGDTDRIFEKFFQGDTDSSGVGLGLFVSRGLARAHGGDITVRPAEHEGSEFVLELPTAG
jgi:two-component system, OmpR family, phosphate regulon sensor histidine kinase PhoR